MSYRKGDIKRTGLLSDMHLIAKVSMGQILGLVEAVDEATGTADAATIAQEVDMHVGDLGPIVDAAEFLGLVAVRGGDLHITDLGRKVLHGSVHERRVLIRGVIDNIPMFRQITGMVRSAGKPLSKRQVLKALSDHVGSHHADQMFRALVYWGRYVRLVEYDSDSERFSLRMPSE